MEKLLLVKERPGIVINSLLYYNITRKNPSNYMSAIGDYVTRKRF